MEISRAVDRQIGKLPFTTLEGDNVILEFEFIDDKRYNILFNDPNVTGLKDKKKKAKGKKDAKPTENPFKEDPTNSKNGYVIFVNKKRNSMLYMVCEKFKKVHMKNSNQIDMITVCCIII